MYYTHHFAHHETLRRACDWLGRLGFHADHSRPESVGTPWLAIAVESGQYDEVAFLVNAIERTDPQGWPSFWHEAQLAHSAPPAENQAHDVATPAQRAVIGWHPIDERRSIAEADLDSFHEAMRH